MLFGLVLTKVLLPVVSHTFVSILTGRELTLAKSDRFLSLYLRAKLIFFQYIVYRCCTSILAYIAFQNTCTLLTHIVT